MSQLPGTALASFGHTFVHATLEFVVTEPSGLCLKYPSLHVSHELEGSSLASSGHTLPHVLFTNI